MKRIFIAVALSICASSPAFALPDRIVAQINSLTEEGTTFIENAGDGLLDISGEYRSPNPRPLTDAEMERVLAIETNASELLEKAPNNSDLAKLLGGVRQLLKAHDDLLIQKKLSSGVDISDEDVRRFHEKNMTHMVEISEAMFAGEGEGSTLEEKLLDDSGKELVSNAYSTALNVLKIRPHDPLMIEVRNFAWTIYERHEELEKELAAQEAESQTKQVAFKESKGRPANCLLVVKGVQAIKAECTFTPLDSDGSFQIMSYNGKYFAYVTVISKGVAQGSWNEEPYAGHAHTKLGELYREDGCWVNDTASVCAY